MGEVGLVMLVMVSNGSGRVRASTNEKAVPDPEPALWVSAPAPGGRSSRTSLGGKYKT